MRYKFFKWIFPIIVLIIWVIILDWWTFGFKALTVFSYSLKAAGALPRAVPNISLVNHLGKNIDISSLKGKYIIVNFIYLNCPSVCHFVSSKIAEVYKNIEKLNKNMLEKLVFITVSFDLERDNPDLLYHYWLHHGALKEWQIAAFMPNEAPFIRSKLEKIGVYIFKKPNGQYNHTVYMFLINTKGEIVNVFDPAGAAEDIAIDIFKVIK